MKKLILLLYLSLLGVGLSAQQQYKPVLDGEIIRWSFINLNTTGNLSSTEIAAYGDTLINDVTYKRWYWDYYFDPDDAEESNINWKNHIPPIHLYYQSAYYYFRESEDASKLYLYVPDWDKEYLLSDMNLQEGETFEFFYGSSGTREASVRSVYFKNGLKHIELNFGYPDNRLTFIESVGPNMWLFPDGYPLFTDLNCFQNQTTFYKNAAIIYPCGYNVNFYCYNCAGINSISEDNYYAFIQKDRIEILFDSEENVDIAIYDMQGKLCYSRNAVSDQKFIIPTASLLKGVYILNIFNKRNNRVESKKFILQ